MTRTFTLLFGYLILFALLGCNNNSKSTSTAESYPEDLLQVLDYHGGLETWNSAQSMTYEIVREAGNEKHQIDLASRKDRIDGNDFSMGYDGDKVWLLADTSYKRDPVFYHNLMFYFYAMPFVVADDGIIYGETSDLVFEGKRYPGVRIGYQSNVGASPEDEYFVHYDPVTKRMEWLGYTVTYFTKEKSKDIHWIRYNDWQDVHGLILPNSMTWYKYENGLPTEPRNIVQFANAEISTKAFEQEIFQIPEGASIAN